MVELESAELRERGIFFGRGRPFAEPGVAPNYGPDRRFNLDRIELDLSIDPAVHALSGRARLHVSPLASGMGEVVLHAEALEIQGLRCAEQDIEWSHADGVLRVKGLRSATVLEIEWKATPARGLYWVGPDSTDPGRAPEVWSQGQDEDSHHYFPCFDHPSARSSFDITIRAPARYEVLSNGRLAERRMEGDLQVWRWLQEEAIPAYLVTVVVAELDVLEDRRGCRYLVPKGWDRALVERVFRLTPEMIETFEARTGVAYPWARYDQVVVHDFIFGGMENVAATTMTDLLLTDERAEAEWSSEHLIAHELAHQWFGDLVTCVDWSQGWLNESWATFMEVVWEEAHRGEAAATLYSFGQAALYLGEADARYQRPIVTYDFREPIDVFDRHLYEKGAVIMRSLRFELGEATFWEGTRRYLEANRLKGVHTRDFQKAMEEVSGRNLDFFFQQWIWGAGHPELTVKLSWSDGLLNVGVSQTQEKPFRFTLRLDIDGRVVDLPIREKERSFALPCAEPQLVSVDPGFRFLSRMKIEAPRSWLERLLAGASCPVVRCRAAKALADSPVPAAVAALARALTGDESWGVRAECARGLSRARGSAAEAALLGAMDSETHAKVRRELVAALGVFPGAEARLFQAVKDGDSGLYAEGDAAVALAKLRSPRVKEAAQILLGRPGWASALQTRAVSALGASRDPAVLPILVAYTGDAHPQRLRSAACVAMATLADEVEGLRGEVVERLGRLALDGPFRVQIGAVDALGRLRDPRGSEVLGRLHASASDGRIRRMAWEALCAVREGRGGDAALATLKGGFEAMEREQTRLRERVEKLEKTP